MSMNSSAEAKNNTGFNSAICCHFEKGLFAVQEEISAFILFQFCLKPYLISNYQKNLLILIFFFFNRDIFLSLTKCFSCQNLSIY